MQHKETLVGGYDTGGLGEVKFHVDYEPFMFVLPPSASVFMLTNSI